MNYDIPEPKTSPKKPRSTKNKWYAIIVILIVLLSSFAVLSAFHPANKVPDATIDSAQNYIQAGNIYNLTLKTNGPFKYAEICWGDNSINIVKSSGDTIFASHVYNNPGIYYIHYTIQFTSSIYKNNTFIPVYVAPLNNNKTANGIIYINNYSKVPAVSDSNIFLSGTYINLSASYSNEPANSTYQVISQTLYLYKNNSLIRTYNLQYKFNYSSQLYENKNNSFLLKNLTNGMYTLKLVTYSASLLDKYINVNETDYTNITYNKDTEYYYNGTYNGRSVIYIEYKNSTNAIDENNGSLLFKSGSSIYYKNSNVSVVKGDTFYISNGSKITALENTSIKLPLGGSYILNNKVYNYKNSTVLKLNRTDTIKFNSTAAVITLNNTYFNYINSSVLYNKGDLIYINNSKFYISSGSELLYGNNSKITYLNDTHAAVAYKTPGIINAGITGDINASNGIYQTDYYMDIPVYNNGSLYINNKVKSITYTSTSPYNTLNPEIADSKSDLQILMNTNQFLVYYNGRSYIPEIAAYLPSISNGGISNNNENYTFHIYDEAYFQDGNKVNAWDVAYSLAADLLLDNKTPQTPGWILAQYLLSGNYYKTNNYTDIANAITVNNSTDNITLHFNMPVNRNLVFKSLSSPGAFITSITYIKDYGNLTWSEKGFNAFKNGTYNKYSLDNTVSNGPYEIYSYIKNYSLVLIKNPYFEGRQGDPVPKINMVIINYRGYLSEIYQDLRLNVTQIAEFPSDYKPYINQLGNVNIYNKTINYTELYNFNANVSIKELDKYSYSNMPSNLFSNITVRETFYYAFGNNYNITKARELWSEFVKNNKYNIKYDRATNDYTYNGNNIVIPIFVNQMSDMKNITSFTLRLKSIINGSSYPIITENSAFILNNEKYGENPMPVYNMLIKSNINETYYYTYLGSTLNYTHLYNNGFNTYNFNITDKNQSMLVKYMEQNITGLNKNYNSKNLNNTVKYFNNLYLYIRSGNDNIMVTYNKYLNLNNSIVGNIIMFNLIN